MTQNRIVSTFLSVALAIGLLAMAAGCATTHPSTDEAEQSSSADDVEVGYGTQKRDQITGAVGTVPEEELEHRRSAAELADLIEGNVAGVQVFPAPGGGLRIRVRGINTFFGGTDPLYVVDGIAVEPNTNGVLQGVNPADVKSITVLKDAAAASIYGARAGNGVVVIKTQ